MHTFETPRPVHLRVELYVGRVTITAEQTDQTTVELKPRDRQAEELLERSRVEQVGDEIRVIVPKGRGGLFGGKSEIDPLTGRRVGLATAIEKTRKRGFVRRVLGMR